MCGGAPTRSAGSKCDWRASAPMTNATALDALHRRCGLATMPLSPSGAAPTFADAVSGAPPLAACAAVCARRGWRCGWAGAGAHRTAGGAGVPAGGTLARGAGPGAGKGAAGRPGEAEAGSLRVACGPATCSRALSSGRSTSLLAAAPRRRCTPATSSSGPAPRASPLTWVLTTLSCGGCAGQARRTWVGLSWLRRPVHCSSVRSPHAKPSPTTYSPSHSSAQARMPVTPPCSPPLTSALLLAAPPRPAARCTQTCVPTGPRPGPVCSVLAPPWRASPSQSTRSAARGHPGLSPLSSTRTCCCRRVRAAPAAGCQCLYLKAGCQRAAELPRLRLSTDVLPTRVPTVAGCVCLTGVSPSPTSASRLPPPRRRICSGA